MFWALLVSVDLFVFVGVRLVHGPLSRKKAAVKKGAQRSSLHLLDYTDRKLHWGPIQWGFAKTNFCYGVKTLSKLVCPIMSLQQYNSPLCSTACMMV